MTVQLPPNSTGTTLDTVTVASKDRQVILVGDTSGTGAITAANANLASGAATANSTVAIGELYSESSLGVQVVGTFVATLIVQVSNDNSNWTTLGTGILNANTGASVASFTAPGAFQADIAGFGYARVTASAYTSGTATVSIRAGAGTASLGLDAPLPTGTNTVGGVTGAVTAGSAIGTTAPVMVAGSDGTNVQRVSTDTTGAIRIAPRTVVVSATAAGLTTATTTYTAGDVMGSEMTLTGMARATGGSGVIQTIIAEDDSVVLSNFDIFLFSAASTPAADNAANSWSDANMQLCVGVISMPAPTASALNSVATLSNVGLAFVTTSSANLFAVMVARTANAVFAGGATSIHFKFVVSQD